MLFWLNDNFGSTKTVSVAPPASAEVEHALEYVRALEDYSEGSDDLKNLVIAVESLSKALFADDNVWKVSSEQLRNASKALRSIKYKWGVIPCAPKDLSSMVNILNLSINACKNAEYDAASAFLHSVVKQLQSFMVRQGSLISDIRRGSPH